MKQVTYAGTSFITGTAVADSLLALVAALGVTGGTASVQVPALGDNDAVTSVDLIIGPSSEVVAIGIDTSAPEIIDAELVRELDDQTRSLARPHAVASSDDLGRAWDVPDLDIT